MCSLPARQATGLIKGDSASACKLKTLITQLNKGLQGMITEKEIGDALYRQYRNRVENKPATKTNDRRRLTKARVVTTGDVIHLREECEVANKKKTEKKGRGRRRPKKAVSDETSGPSMPRTQQQRVQIAQRVTVHIDSEDEFEEWEIESSEPEEEGGFGGEEDSIMDNTPS